jgi:hypothetical protein
MDIIDRLRGAPNVMTENGYTSISKMGRAMLNEAANEIERLQKQAHYHYENGLKKDVEIERLREAMQHIIRWADIAKAKAALKEGE